MATASTVPGQKRTATPRGAASAIVTIKLADWNPRSLQSQCDTTTNLTLGGAYGGITGSVTIPMNTCEDYWLDINTVNKKIAIDYLTDDSPLYGREGQMYMDVAGRYDASDSTVLPIWADYNWVTVGYCSIICSERSSFVAKDSGW